jgi:hypothetical protein
MSNENRDRKRLTVRLNSDIDQMLDRYWKVLTEEKISKNEFIERILKGYMGNNGKLFAGIRTGEVKVLQDAAGRLKYMSKEQYDNTVKKMDSLKVKD